MHTNIEPAAPYPCLVIYLDQTLFSSAACQEFTAAQVRIVGPTQPFMARPCCQTASPNPVRVMNVSLCNLIRLQNGASPANDSRHHGKQGAGGYFFPPTLSATSSARLPVHHTKKTTGARQIQNSAAHLPPSLTGTVSPSRVIVPAWCLARQTPRPDRQKPPGRRRSFGQVTGPAAGSCYGYSALMPAGQLLRGNTHTCSFSVCNSESHRSLL